MNGPITGFAKGEVIPITFDNFVYGRPEKTPDSLDGLDFRFTLRRGFDRTIVQELARGSGITAEIVNGVVTAYLEVQTDDLQPKTSYEYDFWVLDPETGNHRLETSFIHLDEPETENLS